MLIPFETGQGVLKCCYYLSSGGVEICSATAIFLRDLKCIHILLLNKRYISNKNTTESLFPPVFPVEKDSYELSP